ncbi:NADPH-dependent F420 reductase [Streptococcus suis]|uniref:NADPH-dependent F420 reductase n=1 Tax=Streptococcus suis TaxID=1307 RepID=UPI00211D5E08|nr:diguanylate cyclase [Streptococcus suis]UUM56897.1 diguanylate cyclase [Streptococcus suis]
MVIITVFGKGEMGQTIGDLLESDGHQIDYVDREGLQGRALGDVVILVLRYDAIAGVVEENKEAFAGKILVDISNPINFDTWDELVVPAGSSSAEMIAEKLPETKVIKAFNTSSAMMLQTKNVGQSHTPVVHMASDDIDAKEVLAAIIAATGLDTVDVGDLKRARELEALGFLQMRLTKDQKVSPLGGYLLIK